MLQARGRCPHEVMMIEDLGSCTISYDVVCAPKQLEQDILFNFYICGTFS